MSSGFAGELAAAGVDVVRQVLADHGPDSAGRCRTCRKDGLAPVHPCGLADAAAAAARVLTGERAP